MFELERTACGRVIDSEHGEGYRRNINVRGYILRQGDDFIIFHYEKVESIKVGVIDYLFLTSNSTALTLFGYLCNNFVGECVQYVYFKEHKRTANYAEKFLEKLGLEVKENKKAKWKHKWTSTNGYPENEVFEAHTK